MTSLETLIEQVRAILIQTEDSMAKHEIYNQFINESKANNLTEQDFYMKVLKIAHKSIDWNYIEEEKKKKEREKVEKENKEKEVEKELEEVKRQIQYAPAFIDRLIKTAFDDEIVEKDELIRIFDKADRLSQNTYELAEKIDSLLNDRKYKSYPKANFDLPSLRQTLCSTDWHSEERYRKLTTPPPAPFPLKQVVSGSLLFLFFAIIIGYFAWLKPYLRDRDATRMFTFADDASLRKTAVAGVDYNFLRSLNYGTQLLVYSNSGDWVNAKADGQEGYISAQFVLSKKDFYELNGVFGDNESKETISSAKCRKALLKYFQEHNISGKIDSSIQVELYGSVLTKDIWQVFSKGKNVSPNTISYPKITNPNSKFSDFSCIIKNITSNKRKFLLFSFSDQGDPSLVAEEDAPDSGDIKSIKKRVDNGKYTYDVTYVN